MVAVAICHPLRAACTALALYCASALTLYVSQLTHFRSHRIFCFKVLGASGLTPAGLYAPTVGGPPAAGIAKILFFIFVVAFIVFLVLGLVVGSAIF